MSTGMPGQGQSVSSRRHSDRGRGGRFDGRVTQRFRRSRSAVVGSLLVGLALTCALFAPMLAPGGPDQQNLSIGLRPPAWQAGGSWETPLGTDLLGRDILTRIIYGTRVSLAVGLGGALLGAIVGSMLGMLAYWGGPIDRLISWLVSVQLGLPYLLFVIAVIGVLGPSLVNVILVLGLSDFPLFARMVRGEVLTIKGREYVEAARAIGGTPLYILRRHVLVNAVPTLIAVLTFEIASMILYESGLGFLGLSVPPSIPSWGSMLGDGRSHLTSSWWLATFPGLAIIVTTLGINLLGEWLRVELDPRLRGR